MNFLQMVNRARREAGAASSDLGSVQGSLVLDDKRFKDWVNEAWRDVQTRKPDWDWMRETYTFDTLASKSTYSAAEIGLADVATWKRDSVRAYLTGTAYFSEQILSFMDYDTFRNVYEYGPMRTTTGRPVAFTVDTKKRLRFGPVPDGTWTVTGEYWRPATDLVADLDTPDLPGQFHMLIVWLAVLSYGQFEAAPEVIQRATAESNKLMNRLHLDQAPTLTSGPPLA